MSTGDGTLDGGGRIVESVIDKRLIGIEACGAKVLGVAGIFVVGGRYNDSIDGSTCLCNEFELISNAGGRTEIVGASRRRLALHLREANE